MNMKDKINPGKEEVKGKGRKISRKEAIKKVGFAAFSAGTMMLLLNNPAKANGSSPAPPPPWEEGDWE